MASKLELELQRTIMELLQERGLLDEGEALGDFIIMAELANWKERGRTRYANILPPDEAMPPMHRVIGLIEVCSDLLGPIADE